MFSFSRAGNWGIEMLSNLLQVTQMASGTPRNWPGQSGSRAHLFLVSKQKYIWHCPGIVLNHFLFQYVSLKMISAVIFDGDFFWTQDSAVFCCVTSLKKGGSGVERWGCCSTWASVRSLTQEHLPDLESAQMATVLPCYSHHLKKKILRICLLKDSMSLWYQIDPSF